MRLLTALLAALALACFGAPVRASTYTLNHCVKVHAPVTTGSGTNVLLRDRLASRSATSLADR